MAGPAMKEPATPADGQTQLLLDAIHGMTAQLTGRIDEVRTELKAEIGDARTEIKALDKRLSQAEFVVTGTKLGVAWVISAIVLVGIWAEALFQIFWMN